MEKCERCKTEKADGFFIWVAAGMFILMNKFNASARHDPKRANTDAIEDVLNKTENMEYVFWCETCIKNHI